MQEFIAIAVITLKTGENYLTNMPNKKTKKVEAWGVVDKFGELTSVVQLNPFHSSPLAVYHKNKVGKFNEKILKEYKVKVVEVELTYKIK